MDLDHARRQATEIIAASRDGRDPGQERKLARVAAADVLTLGGLIATYLREHAERHQRPRRLIEHPAHLRATGGPARPVSGRRGPARGLGPAARSVAFHGRRGANRARGKLRVLRMGMKAGLVDHNPVVGTVKGRKPRASAYSRSMSCGRSGRQQPSERL